MEMTPNPPAFPNQEQSPSEVIQSEERTEKNTTSALDNTKHRDISDDKEESASMPQPKNNENESDGDNDPLEGIEIEDSAVVTKKDDDRDLLVSSPIRPSRDQPHPSPVFVTTAWPQRSPIDHEHQHRCHIDEKAHASANGSSSSPSCEKEEQQHDEIAHALFTESFDTISACASSENTMGALEEIAGSGVFSPRQKTHTPTAEETIELLSPQHGIHPNDTPNASFDRHKDSIQRYNNPSLLETREDDGHRHRRYHEDFPHSPPQRIIEIDGDDNGCGNISPIKFSPPTENTPSRHRDHRSSRYQEEFPPNMSTGDNQFCKFISTPGTNDSNEQQQHAAEVSFDTSAAGNHSYRHESDNNRESNERVSRKRRANDNDEVVRPASYSTATTLSEAKTPPRRGTGMTHSIKEVGSAKHARSRSISISNNDGFVGGHPHDVGQYHGGGYQSLYPRVPPIPRDISHPHYAGGYYPNPQPVPEGSNLPPSASALNKDQSREYFRAISGTINHNAHSGKTTLSSSPVRPSRHSYPIRNIKQDSQRLYRDPTPRNGPPPIIGGPWMGHGYPSEPRGYPPPRARLPPPHSITDLHWNQHHNRNPNQQHSTIPTFPMIPTHGRPEGRRGTAFESRPSAPRIHQQQLQAPQVPPYHHHYAPVTQVSGVTTKDSFNALRSVRKVFQGCSYLLYPAHMGVNWGSGHQTIHTNPEDLKVARRRIESAICALGGYVKDIQKREESPNTSPSSSNRTQPPISVFRKRMDYDYRSNSTPIVCSNSTSSSEYYRDRFHHRYFIGDSGVSWQVEENPPVFVSTNEDDSFHNRNVGSSRNNGTTRVGMPNGVSKQEDDNTDSFPMGSQASSLGATPVDYNQKMKYRCKLCGQPKQNHVCPYKKSLVRTLGITVCPAVNSYTSAEPGVLTVALSEMNNFVPYGRRSDENSDLDTEVSSRDHSSAYNITPGGSKKQIDSRHYSPASSSLSTSPHSNSHRSPGDNQHPRHEVVHLKQKQQPRGGNLWHPRKPHQNHQGPLFMALALRPEHYRAVTPRAPFRNGSAAKVDDRDDKEDESFEYPHIPLTFLGRKRLTDTLFYLSQSIPSVTADVASLLRMARERDEWDLAVAEVLTQVVVCIHCSDGDYRLNGLKSYLLKIGIAA